MSIFEPILARMNEAGGTDRKAPDAALPRDLWESSTWEGNARWQLARTLAATPLQRLEWLEEALELAWAAGALERRVPAAGAPPTPPTA